MVLRTTRNLHRYGVVRNEALGGIEKGSRCDNEKPARNQILRLISPQAENTPVVGSGA